MGTSVYAENTDETETAGWDLLGVALPERFSRQDTQAKAVSCRFRVIRFIRVETNFLSMR
jgi:hypothetical protein